MAVPQFGLNRFDLGSVERFVADVRKAEELGWDIAFTVDSQLGARDPYILLTLAAQETTRVRLGTLLTNPVTHHPTVTASAFATLDEVSAGRAFLVIGIGDTAVEHSGLEPATVRRLRESTADIRTLLRGGSLDVGRPEPARLRHARPVPVWVAAAGPRALAAAGGGRGRRLHPRRTRPGEPRRRDRCGTRRRHRGGSRRWRGESRADRAHGAGGRPGARSAHRTDYGRGLLRSLAGAVRTRRIDLDWSRPGGAEALHSARLPPHARSGGCG